MRFRLGRRRFSRIPIGHSFVPVVSLDTFDRNRRGFAGRLLIGSVMVSGMALGGCRKEQVQTTATDSTHTAAVSVDSQSQMPDSTRMTMRILPDSDPIAKKMIEQLKRHEGQPVESDYRADASRTLATLLPAIPGYQMLGQPETYDGIDMSRAGATYGDQKDHSKFVRVVVIQQEERDPSNSDERIEKLRALGSVSQEHNGETITAYYMQVGGEPAARTYIPSKKIATVTVYVGKHIMMQLQEGKASSDDHLVSIAKYLDIQRAKQLEQ